VNFLAVAAAKKSGKMSLFPNVFKMHSKESYKTAKAAILL
jgi:hypothetical protein